MGGSSIMHGHGEVAAGIARLLNGDLHGWYIAGMSVIVSTKERSVARLLGGLLDLRVGLVGHLLRRGAHLLGHLLDAVRHLRKVLLPQVSCRKSVAASQLPQVSCRSNSCSACWLSPHGTMLFRYCRPECRFESLTWSAVSSSA